MSVISEFFQAALYKRNQGRVARQVTCVVVCVIVALGAWRLSETLRDQSPGLHFGLPGALLLVGWWVAYRIVNLSTFADFLISVEGEMAKVSWPSRSELFRSSIVVILMIFILALILFGYDLLWKLLLRGLGVLG